MRRLDFLLYPGSVIAATLGLFAAPVGEVDDEHVAGGEPDDLEPEVINPKGRMRGKTTMAKERGR